MKRNVNLFDVKAVERYVSGKKGNGYKNLLLTAYRHFVNYHGIDYEFRRYKTTEKIPCVPLEKSIDQLISYISHTKYGAFLQLIKETGLRGEEVMRLTVNDFDLERNLLTVNNPAKNTLCRQYKLSDKCVSMLYPLIHKNDERLWNGKLSSVLGFIRTKKKQLVKQINDKDIQNVTPLNIRHWVATSLYRKTKDILFVKNFMRHKDLKSTMVYTHLIDFELEDEWVCKVANNIQEAQGLIESGFEYICEMDGVKLFRKRK